MLISNVRFLPDSKSVAASLQGTLLNIKDVASVDHFIHENLKKEIINYVFQFKDIELLSANGLSMFAMNIDKINQHSGKIIIYEPKRLVEYSLRITLLDRKVIICKSFEEATQHLA